MYLSEGGGSSRGRRQRRGEDVVHPLKVSLEDLYNGTSKKLSLSRSVLCSKCNGWVICIHRDAVCFIDQIFSISSWCAVILQ
jgi:DnaJ-class molecular chaperone